MTLAYHCDWEGCDSWQRIRGVHAIGWLKLSTEDDQVPNHFCTLDCLMQWAAAHSEPTETLVEL